MTSHLLSIDRPYFLRQDLTITNSHVTIRATPESFTIATADLVQCHNLMRQLVSFFTHNPEALQQVLEALKWELKKIFKTLAMDHLTAAVDGLKAAAQEWKRAPADKQKLDALLDLQSQTIGRIFLTPKHWYEFMKHYAAIGTSGMTYGASLHLKDKMRMLLCCYAFHVQRGYVRREELKAQGRATQAVWNVRWKDLFKISKKRESSSDSNQYLSFPSANPTHHSEVVQMRILMNSVNAASLLDLHVDRHAISHAWVALGTGPETKVALTMAYNACGVGGDVDIGYGLGSHTPPPFKSVISLNM